jgi:hypothetical protein
MSEENVEIVRSVYRRGDPSRFFDLLDEEIEVDASGVGFLPGYPDLIHGRDAVIDYFRRWWGTWEDYVLSQRRSSMLATTELSSSTTSEDAVGQAGLRSSAAGHPLHPSCGEDGQIQGLCEPGGCPRSRRAVGVGQVPLLDEKRRFAWKGALRPALRAREERAE